MVTCTQTCRRLQSPPAGAKPSLLPAPLSQPGLPYCGFISSPSQPLTTAAVCVARNRFCYPEQRTFHQAGLLSDQVPTRRRRSVPCQAAGEAAGIRCGKRPDSIGTSTSTTGETKTQCTKGLKLNESCARPPSSRPSRPRCCLSTQGDSQLARQRDAGFCFKASDSGFTKNVCSGAGRAPASPAGFASGRRVNHAGGRES